MNRLVFPLALSVLLVACGQPSTPPGGDPTVQAQATQIAALQQQVAALQTSVARPPATSAQPKPPPAATTPTAAARLFFQALLAGDVSGALARMSVAAQSTYTAKLPGMASALAPCAKSVMEVTNSQNNLGTLATVQFTPPCGDLRAAYLSIFPGLATSAPQSGSVTSWSVGVALVNEEWKVTSLGSGF